MGLTMATEDSRNKAPPMPETLEELARDYEPCGASLRRKDASPLRPSPVLDAKDVLRIALAQLDIERAANDVPR